MYIIFSIFKTHDSEKAIGLFNMMAKFQYLNTPQHYNSYIKALASRRDVNFKFLLKISTLKKLWKSINK